MPRLGCCNLGARHALDSWSRPRTSISHRRMLQVSVSSLFQHRGVRQLKVGDSWLTTPRVGTPVKGVVHFLGGAFVGAAPQLAYSLLIDKLAAAGYTVLATPYAVTFQHQHCARGVHQAFVRSVAALHSEGELCWSVPPGAPHIGVGHSNGALLQLLIASLVQPAPYANVIISHNNKQVKDAVPVPLEGLQTLVKGVREELPVRSGPPTEQLLLEVAGRLGPAADWLREAAQRGLAPAVDQLGSVFGEVGDGIVEFSPPPEAVRVLVEQHYATPNTLLVQFEVDAIDETPEIAAILSRKNPAGVTQLLLPGSHVTPCGGDVSWPVGAVFSPFDAIGQLAKSISQTDLRRMANRITLWLDATVSTPGMRGPFSGADGFEANSACIGGGNGIDLGVAEEGGATRTTTDIVLEGSAAGLSAD